MIIELVDAKWHGAPEVIGAYIQTVRNQTVKGQSAKPRRSRITKDHNYEFTHRKAVQVSGGTWRVKQLNAV